MRLSLLPVWLLAACTPTGSDGPDQAGSLEDTTPGLDTEFEQALSTGGTEITQCEAIAILDIVNRENLSVDDLVNLEVHSRAASNIVEARRGPDGQYGTGDDAVFTTLQQLDDVPYVGPVAMDALQAAGAELCAGGDLDLGPTCAEQSVVDFANNPSTTAEDLKDIGVHSSGATSIMAARAGADGTYGTSDDVVFSTIDDLDAVPQVGPATISTLLAWGQAECATTGVIFSPQEYSSSHLASIREAIDEAQTSVDIAIYSFRDADIMDALEAAVARGVTVRVIYQDARDDRKDPEGTRSAELEDLGIEVVWVNKTMHHKFAIIDGPRAHLSQAPDALIITGSGNWSHSAATRFDENTLFLRGDAKLALQYQREFELLWNNSRPVVWNETIPHILGLQISDSDIDNAPGSEALFTSANMRTWNSASYGPTFSGIADQRNVQDELVEYILDADTSIRIASGHMRSRGVYQALLDAKTSNPSLDIQVYLDGQEYTSMWYWESDVADYADCVATDGAAACFDEGSHFSTGLYLAGIDVRFKFYAYRWDYTYADQMHHKYLVIDGDTLLTGSYNISPNAEFDTMENVAVVSATLYPELVSEYTANFDTMWETSRPQGLYDDLLNDIRNGTGSFPIVFDPMALSWPEVTELKRTIRDHCPQVDSDNFRQNPAAHRTCDR